ncbi:hypothetical protein ASG17_03155 [Brevundimonas sp. Leaf363]|uniref:hypothetical protein n=1 Tax=Brevundimonas sp. Leaf363 TaxID=1736353 RepID=UPI0006FFB963|nr:hypothetical protein [Brevundimonas sp. Leaf363]KQS55111.1 hypothetical protein ASG17_03155 [Brevundimonas sp. Leaf363]
MLKSLMVGCLLVLGGLSAASAQDVPTAQAVARRDAAGVTVHYRLPAPVRRAVFANRDTIRDLWTVTTPGLTLTDGAVAGDAPFDSFDLQIRPDAAEVDRVYMGLSTAGDGRVIYGPGLMIQGTRTVLSVETAPGEDSLPQSGQIDGYSYVGPAADVTQDGAASLAIGSNVPPELAQTLRQTFFGALEFYHDRLGLDLSFRPTLVGSIDSPGPYGFRGDVTDTGLISVRFHGDTWREEIDLVGPFVWHEAFHLWNGHGIGLREGDQVPWLHEGGAEYAAVVGSVSTGGMSEATARTNLIRRVNGCRRVLGARDMDPARLRSGNGPYDCGVLIQWLADLEARKAGTGDVFTLWRAMLTAARTSPDGYGVSDFRALLQPDSAVAGLLDGPGATRWATIKARLAELGVTIENQPQDKDFMGAALFHVGGRNCRSSYGFFDDPGALKLDGAECGALSGEPIIDTVEGQNPQTAGRAMFDAVQARCAQGLTVRYATRDGRILEAVCDRPLETPEVWAIADAPALAIQAESARLL